MDSEDQAFPFPLPQEIAQFLQRNFPEGFRALKWSYLKGDASDRRYIRLKVPCSSGEKKTFVLMQLAQPWTPEEGRGELPFVNIARHLAGTGVPVPAVFLDVSEKGFVLLEDVGDVTLETYLESCSSEERRRCYREAVEILVRMQTKASSPSGVPCYALSYAFEAKTFFQELCFFLEYAVEGLWQQKLSAGAREEMTGQFMRLCKEIAGYPQTFTHRDYHARNLMVRDTGLAVLDFQDARMGPVTYDLVSLLRDAYVRLASEEQEELIEMYRESCSSAGFSLPGTDEFSRAFRRTGVQRNLKAIGTFAYQAVAKGNEDYLVSVPNTLESLNRALQEDPDLAPLRRALMPYLKGL